MRYSRAIADPGGPDTAGQASDDAAVPGADRTLWKADKAVHRVETFALAVDVMRTNKERRPNRQSSARDTAKLLFAQVTRMLGGAGETCDTTPENYAALRVLLDQIRPL